MTKFVSTVALTEFWAQVKKHVSDSIAALSTVYAAISHTHTTSEITDLQGVLDGKADKVHTHVSADITDLQEKLDLKANKSEVEASLNLKAPLADPAFTGVPTAPTASVGTNTTQIATTEFVVGQVADAIGKVDRLYYKVVSALPEVSAADPRTIYLVKNISESGNNVYDEYLFIAGEGGSGSFEKIGTTGVHLEDYWAKADLVEMTADDVKAICV